LHHDSSPAIACRTPRVTKFLATVSVDAWDAWFRWREDGELRDRTIDATWQRVADALATVEADRGAEHARGFTDAFAHWRMLPDERLLENAGTLRNITLAPAPVAVLNASAFLADRGPGGSLDSARVAAVAALAVRALDDALLLAGANPGLAPGLRIGIIGMADAIAGCGLEYDSDAARDLAARFALALQEGCLAGAIELAAERGEVAMDPAVLAARLRACGVDAGLIADALRWGVRHRCCTAISSQPRLALLANNCADALDPLSQPAPARSRSGRGADPDRTPSGGSAPHAANSAPEATPPPDPIAQLRLRAAIQPHVDHPIDYPLLSRHAPGAELRTRCGELAARTGLPAPRWRVLEPARDRVE
jgi:ribonucleoside-diphosphate reductase alpha chain